MRYLLLISLFWCSTAMASTVTLEEVMKYGRCGEFSGDSRWYERIYQNRIYRIESSCGMDSCKEADKATINLYFESQLIDSKEYPVKNGVIQN